MLACLRTAWALRRATATAYPCRTLATAAAPRVNVRRSLAQFLKRVHPDVLHSHPAPVQQANLKSLQSLNALIEVLQSRCDRATTTGPLPPPHSAYHLSFHYLERADDGSRRLELYRTTVVVPADLRRPEAQLTHANEAAWQRWQGFAQQVVRSLTSFAAQAQEPDEAMQAAAREAMAGAAPSAGSAAFSSIPGLTERQVRKQMYSGLRRLLVYEGHVLDEVAKGSAPGMRMRKQAQEHEMREFVQSMFVRDRVLLRNVPLAARGEAVQRLFALLCEHSGPLRLFDRKLWTNVYIVLAGGDRGASYRVDRQRGVLHMPYAFEARDAVAFLSQHLLAAHHRRGTEWDSVAVRQRLSRTAIAGHGAAEGAEAEGVAEGVADLFQHLQFGDAAKQPQPQQQQRQQQQQQQQQQRQHHHHHHHHHHQQQQQQQHRHQQRAQDQRRSAHERSRQAWGADEEEPAPTLGAADRTTLQRWQHAPEFWQEESDAERVFDEDDTHHPRHAVS